MDGVIRWLELNGFNRASTVREPGDYAVRGGILDLFAPGMDAAGAARFLRRHAGIDPQLRSGDAAHRRWQLRALDLVPVAEFQLTTETIRRFRTGYVAAFGAADPRRLLYEAVSEGRRHPGMEHWLPLFHDKLDTLFDYRAGRAGGARAAGRGRRARAAGADRGLLRGAQGGARRATARHALQAAAAGPALSRRKPNGRSGSNDRGAGAADAVRGAGRRRRDRRCRRARRATISRPSAPSNAANVFDAVTQARPGAAGGRQARRHRAVERRRARAHEPRAGRPRPAQPDAGRVLARGAGAAEARRSRSRCSASKAASRPPTSPSSASRTSWATGWCGRGARRKRAGQFHRRGDEPLRRRSRRACRSRHRPLHRLAEPSRRPARRTTAWKSTTPSGAKLYLPVENIELLSRYGSEDTGVELDRLGGAGWQTRKARLKNRIREMAGELIKIAAERQLREAPKLVDRRRRSTTSSAPASPTRRPRTSRPRSTRCSTISPPAGRWTG